MVFFSSHHSINHLTRDTEKYKKDCFLRKEETVLRMAERAGVLVRLFQLNTNPYYLEKCILTEELPPSD